MADVEKSVQVTASSPRHSIAHADAIPYIDPELEKRTLRKFDLFVLPQMMILILIAYLDRSNIGW